MAGRRGANGEGGRLISGPVALASLLPLLKDLCPEAGVLKGVLQGLATFPRERTAIQTPGSSPSVAVNS